jgi:uncharacterized protein YwgA
MEANVRHVVLRAVELTGARPNGKTYMQKLCFFVSKLTNQPMGYRAHYYGPYSDEVSAALSFLTAAGLVTETRHGGGVAGTGGWEIARFDYSLTEQGRRSIAQLNRQLPQEAETIRQAIERVFNAGDQNYIELSFAAKTNWILENDGGPMTFDGIAHAADKFRWNVSGTDVKKAATFLSNLGLVQVKPS